MSPIAPPRWLIFALAGFALIATVLTPLARAQSNYATPYYFTTFAGSGVQGSATDGTGTAATFQFPHAVAFDSSGNLFVADTQNFRIRRISPAGVVTTVTGPNGTVLSFGSLRGIDVDGSGDIYVGEFTEQRIQKVTPAGVVTTLAGLLNTAGSTDGTGSAARFSQPVGVAVDPEGNVFVADFGNHAIRRITSAGVVTTFAGLTGTPGSVNGTGEDARFNLPYNIALDGARNLYVTDAGNSTVRKISPARVVTTLAGTAGTQGSLDATGTAARFNSPLGIAVDANGNVYVSGDSSIRKITPAGVVTTLAGVPGSTGNADGLGSAARFDSPRGIAVDGAGNVFLADALNNKIRRSVFPPALTTTTPNLTAPIGNSLQLNLHATSDYPLTYQWRKNGTAISGATTTSLFLNNLQLTDTGTYSAVVSNIAGSSTNAGTIVTVAGITTQPVSQIVTAGSPVQFSVTTTPATGLPLQWRKNGVAIAGATNAVFSISSAAPADAGTYSVRVTMGFDFRTSNDATLTVNVPVSTQPVTHTVTVGSPVQFNFTGATAGTSFQWRKNGTPIPGATNASFIINSAALTDAGDYTVVFTTGGVSQTSNTATLIVLPVSAPAIITQPASQTVVVGTAAQFSVAATSPVGMSFQWRKNGVAISGATNEGFSIATASLTDTGTYSVAVSNAGGATISNNATLTVNAPVGTPPTFTTQPAGQTVNAGSVISLSVSAAGTQPLSFQWFKNGTAIAGATAILFSISNAVPADDASYSVVVTNSAGTSTSSAAVVRVVVPPTIATQPASQFAVVGGSAGFSVTANGTTPFAFQWRKDGVDLTSATTSTLTLNPVQPTDAGSYTVNVTNSAGTVASAAATLTVGPSSRLANVSIRTSLAAGQTVIVGLAVEGGSRDVLVRAIGPSLAAFGVTGVMVDPRLELFRSTTLVIANDDWPAALEPTFASSGAFGLNLGSRDAAFRQGLNGAFSIQTRGTGPGVVLVEAYDLGDASVSRLINVSARNRVGTGDDILIAGFTLTGTGTKQVLIRAVGPGLAAFGVTGTLVDPRLDVFNSAGSRLVENDNWAAALATTFNSVGAFALPNGSRDAALLITLPVGSYTVQVRGADGGTGEAIVEVYEVP